MLELLDFAATKAAGKEKIQHPGTFNANPLSAAAGVATLEIIGSGDACERANRFGEELRSGLNEVFAEERVRWAAHGSYSGFHIWTDAEEPGQFDAEAGIPQMLEKGRGEGIGPKLRLALIANGVDVNGGPGGTISATHGPAEMEATVGAFRTAIRALRRDGELAS